jgi:hypothetical protein
MSYFAHAFSKAFVGTKGDQVAGPGLNGVGNGLLLDASVPTSELGNAANLGLGTYGFFNKDNYLSVNTASAEVASGQSLILAGASIMPNDKIGPFHGGYAESNKSKYINPKLVTNFYKMSDAVPEQAIVHIGDTNFQGGTTVTGTFPCGSGYTDGEYTNVPTTGGSGTGLTLDVVVENGEIVSVVENQVGTGYAVGDNDIEPDATALGLDPLGEACDTITVTEVGTQECEFKFYCGETYNLFINLHGAPILRFLNHDAYETFAAYTGCCPDDAISPVPVDSTLVMANWAQQIVEHPHMKDFIRPIVFDQAGNPWFATAEEAVAEGWPATQIWSNYVSAGVVPGALAGIRLIGAYVDTKFENCTFQTSDYFNKEVVQMEVQLRDETGDPCKFEGICVVTECCGFGGQGFGETYLRELILSESYLQKFMSTDPRIREITQGNALRDAIDRTRFYTKYVIQHVVPRYNNPSSVHDNDQYNLVIYVPAGVTATQLETFMETWLTAAGNPLGPDIEANGVTDVGPHVACRPVEIPTP